MSLRPNLCMTVFKDANEINDMHPYAADKICLTMIMKYIA